MFHPALWLELARWRRAGRQARLWWRDDDAAGGSAALDRLLQSSRAARVPLALAVLPSGDMATLGERLARACLVTPIQHGADHQNRRNGPVGGEFPHHWPQDQLEAALREGWSRIEGLPRARPVFAPPWNDIHPALPAALAACGFAGWSAEGTLGAGPVLARADAHLDLMRWRGGARFRGRWRILKALTAELTRRRRAGLWDAPIGLLTHHLDHDEAAWRFLEAFLIWTVEQRQLTWVALADVLAITAEPRPVRHTALTVRTRRSLQTGFLAYAPGLGEGAADGARG